MALSILVRITEKAPRFPTDRTNLDCQIYVELATDYVGALLERMSTGHIAARPCLDAPQSIRLRLTSEHSSPINRRGYRRRALATPIAFYLLRFLFVDPGKAGAGMRLRLEELIEFRMNCLRVTMLASLNKQRHAPCCERRDSVPIERLGVESDPKKSVERHGGKGPRTRCYGPEQRQYSSCKTRHVPAHPLSRARGL
jgi:hypothetical protein